MLSLRSRDATWALMVGWVRYRASAAREKLPFSTTQAKASSSLMSMSIQGLLPGVKPRRQGANSRRRVSTRRRLWREYVGIEPT